MKLFKGLFRSRDKPQNRVSSTFSFLFGGTSSGKTVNERTAMQATAVYACVRILADVRFSKNVSVMIFIGIIKRSRIIEYGAK